MSDISMSDTFCNVLPLKVVSMIHIIYTSILCGYLLPYFIIYDNNNTLTAIKMDGKDLLSELSSSTIKSNDTRFFERVCGPTTIL